MDALQVLYYIIAASLLIIIIIMSYIAYQIGKLLITFRKLVENTLNITSSMDIFKNRMLAGALGVISAVLSLMTRRRR